MTLEGISRVGGPIDDQEVPVAAKNVARTFAETDVKISHTDTEVSGESIQLLYDYPAINYSHSSDLTTTNKTGVVIKPTKPVTEVQATVMTNTDANSAEIIRLSDNTTVASSTTNKWVGGTYTFSSLSLSSGTEYAVVATADYPSQSADSTYPDSAANFDVTAAYNAGKTTADATYQWSEIKCLTEATSGTAYVKWANPNDVYAWDVAQFTRTLDGETVDIYLEESTDGGSTWNQIAGPISRGDSVPASTPEANVRFRVELSRASTANNPTCDSLALRWKL